MQAIDVVARWGADGRVDPTQFVWNESVYPVQAVGRQWTDDIGLHVLVMASGGRSFELVFERAALTWSLGKPGQSQFDVV